MYRGHSEFTENLVSIVTPVFNGEIHLPMMLDSILNQTYPQMEMVLVDDGSTDQTIQIAERYRQRFAEKGFSFRIIRSAHKNASAAINQGLPYVTGEYLIWPDSDDILEPGSIEKRVEFLKRNSQYQCVRSLSYYIDPDTGESRKAEEQTGDLKKEFLFWDILESKTFVCCGCYMLKSECFFTIYPNRHIPEYPVGQNFQMLLPYMYQHRCPTLCEPLYGVCVREGSHSRRALTQAEEEQKYLDYENLVDEIAKICGIYDRKSLRRIGRWKARRRYSISLKYGREKQMLCALYQLFRCRGMTKDLLTETFWRLWNKIFH